MKCTFVCEVMGPFAFTLNGVNYNLSKGSEVELDENNDYVQTLVKRQILTKKTPQQAPPVQPVKKEEPPKQQGSGKQEKKEDKKDIKQPEK